MIIECRALYLSCPAYFSYRYKEKERCILPEPYIETHTGRHGLCSRSHRAARTTAACSAHISGIRNSGSRLSNLGGRASKGMLLSYFFGELQTAFCYNKQVNVPGGTGRKAGPPQKSKQHVNNTSEKTKKQSSHLSGKVRK